MIIRKLFKFEGSHIVRNCTSERCSKSIHGHSYKVEVFLTADALDNAGMVVDFGLLTPFKKVIDLFDHTHLLWVADEKEYRNFIKSENQRWIELDCNPSAENLALIFHYFFERIVTHTVWENGEQGVFVKGVRVHETDTGYAETEIDDLPRYVESYTPVTGMSDELILSTGSEFVISPSFSVNNPKATQQC